MNSIRLTCLKDALYARLVNWLWVRHPDAVNPAKSGHRPEWMPGIKWGQCLGEEECPYMRRWVINGGRLGSLRIHHWYRGDDDRALHDHAWWFVTTVLKGGYTDVSDKECELCSGDGKGRGRGGAIRDYECQECDGLGCTVVREQMKRFCPTFRPAFHRHTVEVDPGGCWTIMITGPWSRKWGFWVGQKRDQFLGVRKYFKQFGHPPCAEE